MCRGVPLSNSSSAELTLASKVKHIVALACISSLRPHHPFAPKVFKTTEVRTMINVGDKVWCAERDGCITIRNCLNGQVWKRDTFGVPVFSRPRIQGSDIVPDVCIC